MCLRDLSLKPKAPVVVLSVWRGVEHAVHVVQQTVLHQLVHYLGGHGWGSVGIVQHRVV